MKQKKDIKPSSEGFDFSCHYFLEELNNGHGNSVFLCMVTPYSGVYVTATGQEQKAQLFISSVTLTIRYTNEGKHTDLNWIGAEIASWEPYAAGMKLKHQQLPGQLIITDPTTIAELRKAFRHEKFINPTTHKFWGSGKAKLAWIGLIVIGVLVGAYFLLLPWIGDKMARNFPKDREIELGKAMGKSSISGQAVDQDATKWINRFYQSLAFDSTYPISITVVRSPILNAYAVPGGPIVVYDALLKKIKTPEELAALLGHESSHISERHTLRNLFRSLSQRSFWLLLFGTDGGMVAFLAEQGEELKGLSYSRSLETEADDKGMEKMAASGIDLHGMADLMKILNSETKGEEPPAFLSTHPIFKDRIENINSQINKIPLKEVKGNWKQVWNERPGTGANNSW